VGDVDLVRLRSGFARLTDECATVVTLEHGLDLDDVTMERFAFVGESGCDEDACFEVALPFLVDRAAVIRAIGETLQAQSENNSADLKLEMLTFQRLEIRVFLERGAPLFNQAGNTSDSDGQT